jgi:urease accessory protein
MLPHYLGHLLHLTDSTLPIGAYNHSNGLETVVQQRRIHDAASLETYVHDVMAYNVVHNDAAYLSLAYDAIVGNDLPRVIELEQELHASKTARETREASLKLGMRLLKIFSRYPEHRRSELAQRYQDSLAAQNALGMYPVVFALYAVIGGIPKADTLYAFYYNSVSAMVTNGVKLIPLSQMDGQDIVVKLRNDMNDWVAQSLDPDRDWLGASTVASDIHAMQHERLYTRLYMS